MGHAIEFLAEHGRMLAVGASIVLGIGALAVASRRAPIERQRLAELTLVCVVIWLILACLPIPRSRLAATADSEVDRVDLSIETAVGRPAEHAAIPADLIAALTVSPDTTAPPPDGFRGATRSANAVTIDNPSPTVVPDEITGAAKLAVPAGPTASIAIDWPRTLVALYVGCGLAACVWLAAARLMLGAIVMRASRPEPWLDELFASLARRQGRAPRLLTSGRCRRPFSFGILRPTIVLPDASCKPERSRQLREVLLHELSHVRQRDAWGQQLFNLLLPLFFLHPIYWWLRRQAEFARELVADDWAAGHSTPESYARQLIALARSRGAVRVGSLGALGAFNSPSQFYRRMKMLIHRREPLQTGTSRTWKLASLASALLVVGSLAWFVGVPPAAAQPSDAEYQRQQAELEELKVRQLKLAEEMRAKEEQAQRHAFEKYEKLMSAIKQAESFEELKKYEAALDQVVRKKTTRDEQDRPGKTGEVLERLRDKLAKAGVDSPEELEQLAAALEQAEVQLNNVRRKYEAEMQRYNEELKSSDVPVHVAEQIQKLREAFEAERAARAQAEDQSALAEERARRVEYHNLRVAEQAAKAADEQAQAVKQAAQAAEEYKRAFQQFDEAAAKVDPAQSQEKSKGPVADPFGGGAAPAQLAGSGTLLDLVSLANSYTDAVGNLRIAQVKLESIGKAAEGNAASREEQLIASVTVETAQSKVELLRQIVKAAYEAAEAEMQRAMSTLERVQKLVETGAIPTTEVIGAESEAARARSNVEILKLILSRG